MTTKKTAPKKPQTFHIDTDELDPSDVVPHVPHADYCTPDYVATMRDLGMLQLTTDHALDVLESFATHAEDSMLPTAAATFRSLALALRGPFVNDTLYEITADLGMARTEPSHITRARNRLDGAKIYVGRTYAAAVHLAEVFNLDPSYTSGEDEDEDEDEPEDDETED